MTLFISLRYYIIIIILFLLNKLSTNVISIDQIE